MYPCTRLHQLHFCGTQVSNSLSNDFPVSFAQTKHAAPFSCLKKKILIAALVVSETWNLLVFCCSSLCLGAWDMRQTWAIHPAVWIDVADLPRLCYSKERTHTSWILLISLGVTVTSWPVCKKQLLPYSSSPPIADLTSEFCKPFQQIHRFHT